MFDFPKFEKAFLQVLNC